MGVGEGKSRIFQLKRSLVSSLISCLGTDIALKRMSVGDTIQARPVSKEKLHAKMYAFEAVLLSSSVNTCEAHLDGPLAAPMLVSCQ